MSFRESVPQGPSDSCHAGVSCSQACKHRLWKLYWSLKVFMDIQLSEMLWILFSFLFLYFPSIRAFSRLKKKKQTNKTSNQQLVWSLLSTFACVRLSLSLLSSCLSKLCRILCCLYWGWDLPALGTLLPVASPWWLQRTKSHTMSEKPSPSPSSIVLFMVVQGAGSCLRCWGGGLVHLLRLLQTQQGLSHCSHSILGSIISQCPACKTAKPSQSHVHRSVTPGFKPSPAWAAEGAGLH